jgi:hypothetical protein
MTPIYDEFECADGSIIGKYHRNINSNNQDSYIKTEDDDHIIAVVCDGCGSGVTSEVGSILGSSIVSFELNASGLHRLGDDRKEIEFCLERVQRSAEGRIESIAHEVGLPIVIAIAESFLFTIVAAVIGRDYTYIISFGDGFYAINNTIKEIGPFENNAPPYIAYGVIKEYVKGASQMKFVLNEIVLTSDLQSLLIATDGLDDLIKARKNKLPGRDELVGDVSQFWTDDIYFSDIGAVCKKLSLINRSVANFDRLVYEHGYLGDDTTLISIRRKRY